MTVLVVPNSLHHRSNQRASLSVKAVPPAYTEAPGAPTPIPAITTPTPLVVLPILPSILLNFFRLVSNSADFSAALLSAANLDAASFSLLLYVLLILHLQLMSVLPL